MTITLETLHIASNQDIFDQCINHLRQQGEPAMTDEASRTCQYRYNGLKCAIGCFIANDEYNPAMEGCTWSILHIKYIKTDMPSYRHTLLRNLQNIHDTYYTNEWEYQWIQLAKKFKLTYTPPKITHD